MPTRKSSGATPNPEPKRPRGRPRKTTPTGSTTPGLRQTIKPTGPKRKIALESYTTVDENVPLSDDAERRYRNQVMIVNALQERWKELGCPVTAEGGSTGRATIIHPLLGELQQAEALAGRLLERCKDKRPVGRPRGQPQSPDRQGTSPTINRLRKIA